MMPLSQINLERTLSPTQMVGRWLDSTGLHQHHCQSAG